VAQQTLDFVIAQQVTGQADVARLIKSVGALDAEMQKLRSASASMSGGFNQAANAIRGNTNVLDAQSKALRNQRMGMQQAGMQINDFVTSVSTGASPVVAFNQQIGQLGYAMSMMQGRTAAVGRFLAGSWSILVIGAAMALGPLIENLLGVGQEADKTKVSLEELESITQARVDSETDIRLALAKTSGEYRAIQKEIQNTILQKHNLLRVTHQEISQNFALAKIERARIRTKITGAGAAREQAEMGTAQGIALFIAEGELASQQEGLLKSTAALEKSTTALNASRLRIIQTDKSAARAAKTATDRVKDSISPMQSFLDSLQKTDDRLNLAREAYLNGAISASQYRQEVERAEKSQRSFAKVSDDLIKVLDKGKTAFKLPDMVSEVKVPEGLQQIIDKNRDVRQSFDAIGNSVANGFQSMITGAQSFGDAMRGIIQSVINELFRLFVVQQIVGFVTKTLGSVTGVPIEAPPARALGGSVGANQPYLVGERGPELFMPGKSGTVIPTQNTRGMGGGGSTINVSVDARGATSPEMVRQQVQQGILEAAPSIVAAAEQRTISTLRRPRLAGVM
jgi:hypothetical protein